MNFNFFIKNDNNDLFFLYLILFFISTLALLRISNGSDYLLIGKEFNSLKGIIVFSFALILVFFFYKNINNISDIFHKYFFFFACTVICYGFIECSYKFVGLKYDFILNFLLFFTYDIKGPMSNHLVLFFREHSYASILLNIINSYFLIYFLNHYNHVHKRIISFFGYIISIVFLLISFSKLGLITVVFTHTLIILILFFFFWKKILLFTCFLFIFNIPALFFLSRNTSFNFLELIDKTIMIFQNQLYSSSLKLKSLEIFLKDPLIIFIPEGVNNFKYLIYDYVKNDLLDFNKYPITKNYLIDGSKTMDGQVFYLGILGEFGVFFFMLFILLNLYIGIKIVSILVTTHLNKNFANSFHYTFIFSTFVIIILSFFSLHSYNLFFIYIFIGLILHEIRRHKKI